MKWARSSNVSGYGGRGMVSFCLCLRRSSAYSMPTSWAMERERGEVEGKNYLPSQVSVGDEETSLKTPPQTIVAYSLPCMYLLFLLWEIRSSDSCTTLDQNKSKWQFVNSQNCWSEPHLDLLSADCDVGVRQIAHELKHAHANLNCSLCAQSCTKSVVRFVSSIDAKSWSAARG